MNEQILKQMAAELAEIKQLLASILTERQDQDRQSKHHAEMAMVDAMGIDPVQYLKDRAKRDQYANRKARKTPRKPAH